MNKYFISIILIYIFSAAEAGADNTKIVPVLSYDFISLEKQNIYMPGAGIIFTLGDLKPKDLKDRDCFYLAGLYKTAILTKEPKYGYPDIYYTIDFMANYRKTKNQYLFLLKSKSDKPVIGGLNTFQLGLLYGRELYYSDCFTFTLGGGVVISDFDAPWGADLPGIPVPLVRMQYNSEWISLTVDFPVLQGFSFTVAPEKQLRFHGSFKIDQYNDFRDIIYKLTVSYRFFTKSYRFGDFAGIELGFKNDGFSFWFENNDDSYTMNYYSMFTGFDVSFVKLTGGYAFGGRELYKGEHVRDLGKGFYLSIQGAYSF